MPSVSQQRVKNPTDFTDIVWCVTKRSSALGACYSQGEGLKRQALVLGSLGHSWQHSLVGEEE